MTVKWIALGLTRPWQPSDDGDEPQHPGAGQRGLARGHGAGQPGGPGQPLHVLPLLLQPAVHLQAAGGHCGPGAAELHRARLPPERHPVADAGPGGYPGRQLPRGPFR